MRTVSSREAALPRDVRLESGTERRECVHYFFADLLHGVSLDVLDLMPMRSRDSSHDKISDDIVLRLFVESVTQHTTNETSKLGMQTLAAGEEFTEEK